MVTSPVNHELRERIPEEDEESSGSLCSSPHCMEDEDSPLDLGSHDWEVSRMRHSLNGYQFVKTSYSQSPLPEEMVN